MFERAVQEVDIFKGLTQPQVQELYTWLQRREFPAGVEIFKEGQPADGLYLLTEGTVVVVKASARGKFKLTEIHAPSFFGEIGLLYDKARSAGVKAQTQVTAGFLPAPLFESKLAGNNLAALRVALNLGRILCQRLSETSNQLATKTAAVSRVRRN